MHNSVYEKEIEDLFKFALFVKEGFHEHAEIYNN